ncbi:MAG: hypothetical protein LBM06_06195 [Prevotellaceae bacterium]|jgi:hypothetical protein|nr:hypothetical protein [Prevotellaceae bacterium]
MSNSKDTLVWQRWHICTIVAIGCLFFTCTENDLFDPFSDTNDTTQIVTAREWFEDIYGVSVETRVPGDSIMSSAITFDWDNAQTYKKGNSETVEVPIKDGWSLLITDETTGEQLLDGARIDSLYNLTRLVIETNRKEDTTRSFIMTFVGSYDYLTSAKSLRKNSYLKRASDFDGTVLFYTVESDFMNGWRYQKGKIIASLSPRKVGGNIWSQTRALYPQYDCYLVWKEYYSYTIAGNEIYFHTEIGNVHEECYLIGMYEGGNDGGNAIGGGGGSTTDPKDDAPKSSKIFRNSSWSDKEWEIIESWLNKIIDKSCMGSNMYNGLVTLLNGKTISITFTNNSSSSFDKDGIHISNKNMESNMLFHEMFHLYRAYNSANASAYNDGLMNGELEAYFAQYLYVSSLDEYKDTAGRWSSRYTDNQKYQAIRGVGEIIDQYVRFKDGRNASDLVDALNNAINTLRDYGYSNDRYPYKPIENPIDNFRNIQQLTEGCEK